MSEYKKLAETIDKHWCEMAAICMVRRCFERMKAFGLPTDSVRAAIDSMKNKD